MLQDVHKAKKKILRQITLYNETATKDSSDPILKARNLIIEKINHFNKTLRDKQDKVEGEDDDLEWNVPCFDSKIIKNCV